MDEGFVRGDNIKLNIALGDNIKLTKVLYVVTSFDWVRWNTHPAGLSQKDIGSA